MSSPEQTQPERPASAPPKADYASVAASANKPPPPAATKVTAPAEPEAAPVDEVAPAPPGERDETADDADGDDRDDRDDRADTNSTFSGGTLPEFYPRGYAPAMCAPAAGSYGDFAHPNFHALPSPPGVDMYGSPSPPESASGGFELLMQLPPTARSGIGALLLESAGMQTTIAGMQATIANQGHHIYDLEQKLAAAYEHARNLCLLVPIPPEIQRVLDDHPEAIHDCCRTLQHYTRNEDGPTAFFCGATLAELQKQYACQVCDGSVTINLLGVPSEVCATCAARPQVGSPPPLPAAVRATLQIPGICGDCRSHKNAKYGGKGELPTEFFCPRCLAGLIAGMECSTDGCTNAPTVNAFGTINQKCWSCRGLPIPKTVRALKDKIEPCEHCDRGANIVMEACPEGEGRRPHMIRFFCGGCTHEGQRACGVKCAVPDCEKVTFFDSLGRIPGKRCVDCAKAGLRLCSTRDCSEVCSGDGPRCDTCMVRFAEAAAGGSRKKRGAK